MCNRNLNDYRKRIESLNDVELMMEIENLKSVVIRNELTTEKRTFLRDVLLIALDENLKRWALQEVA